MLDSGNYVVHTCYLLPKAPVQQQGKNVQEFNVKFAIQSLSTGHELQFLSEDNPKKGKAEMASKYAVLMLLIISIVCAKEALAFDECTTDSECFSPSPSLTSFALWPYYYSTLFSLVLSSPSLNTANAIVTLIFKTVLSCSRLS